MQYRGTLALHDLDAAEFDKIVQKSGTTWNGTANPPAYLKSQLNGGFGPRDIKTGRIGNWMCIHNGYPSTTNYISIKENLSLNQLTSMLLHSLKVVKILK